MTLDLLKIENKLEPQKGYALISDPLSDDDYFGHSVVLLTEHGTEGSVGFVLNKETVYILPELIKEIELPFKIYKGGPVEPNSLHYIHTYGQIKNTIKINEGLYWGGDFEQIKDWINSGIIDSKQIQFFLGYSGWASHQLKHELDNNLWIVAEIEKDEIFFSETERFWREKVKRIGGELKKWLNVPENPSLN